MVMMGLFLACQIVSYWLPLIRNCGTTKPVVLAGNKVCMCVSVVCVSV